jgi:hypothetical protein
LNSGDWLYDEKVLKIVVPQLAGFDAVYGNMIKIYPDGKQQLDKGVNGQELGLKTFIEGTINHSACFIQSKLFDKYGLYDENLSIVSDWKFFLTTFGLNNSNVHYLDYPFTCFAMDGISNSNLQLRDLERSEVLNKIVPRPLYRDYLNTKKIEVTLNSPRIKKFLQTDQRKISRKLYSLIFRLFS